MAARSASASGRRPKLQGSSKRLDHSPYALKLRPPVLKPRGRQAKTEKVRLREPLRSRSKGCQSTSTAPSAWTDSEWGSKTEWGSKSTLLSLQHLKPNCWPWSPRNLHASASAPSLCGVKELKRSFHSKAVRPLAWLSPPTDQEEVAARLTGTLRQEDEAPKQVDIQDLDFAADVESTMLAPKLRKNPRGRRGSCLKLKSSTGGEPMGPALEYPHGELLASVAEAEARFIARDHATDYDLPRMKVMFNRFAMDGEVQKENLPMIFSYLGFLKVSDNEVREAADEVSTYPSLDFHDFGAVYEQVVLRERELLTPKLSQWLSEHEPREDVAEAMRRFLFGLGIICTKEVVTEMLQAGSLQQRYCDCMEELWRVLAAHRACEGFSYEDLDKAKEEYDRMCRASRLTTGPLISEALLSLQSVYCAEHLNSIVGEIGEEQLEKAPISFYEFLQMHRRLHYITMKALGEAFEKVDGDRDGLVTSSEVGEVLRQLGFTLLRVEMQELLESIGAEKEDRLHFDGVYNLLVEARNQHGFSRQEADDLRIHFDAFCDEDGEMPNLQMYDLLRYVGHESTLDEVKEMLDQVDYNHNGTMDRREYLRLMRLQKEANLLGYRNAWCSSKMRCGRKAHQVVHNALHARLNKHPEILGRLLAVTGRSEIARAAADFDSFAQLAEHLRKQIPLESRKYASFKEVEYEALRSIFQQFSEQPDGSISLRDFLTMMEEVRDVHTKGGRMWLLESLNEARQAARDCGVSEKDVGNVGSPRVRLMPCLHFVRQMVQRHLRQVTIKENDVLSALKFSKGEVAQFRALFRKLHKEQKEGSGRGQLKRTATGRLQAGVMKVMSQRRRSLDDSQGAMDLEPTDEIAEEDSGAQSFAEWINSFTQVQRVPCSAVLRLIQPLGLRLDVPQQKGQLNRKLTELSDQAGLDFPGFLQLMQWMLDNDFCDINRMAAKHLEHQKTVEEDSDFGEEDENSKTTVSFANIERWRSQRHMSVM